MARMELVGVVRVTLTTRVTMPELGECESSAWANETTGSAALVRTAAGITLDLVNVRRWRGGDGRRVSGGVCQPRSEVGGDSGSLKCT